VRDAYHRFQNKEDLFGQPETVGGSFALTLRMDELALAHEVKAQ
jgi:hypothetical protein